MRQIPTIKSISPNEIILDCSITPAQNHVMEAITRLGKIRFSDREKQFVEGKIRFGLQSVKIRASLVERKPHQTHVVIQASSDDIWSAGAKNATKRLVETLRNLDNPGYEPDRLGINPAALIGLIIGFIFLISIILLLIMEYVFPLLYD